MASVGECYFHKRFNTFIYGKIQFTMAFCIQVPLVYSHFVDFTLAITLYNYCTTAMSTFTFSDTYKYTVCIQSRANWNIWTLVRRIKTLVLLSKEANKNKPYPKQFGLIVAGFVLLMSVYQFTLSFHVITFTSNYIHNLHCHFM